MPNQRSSLTATTREQTKLLREIKAQKDKLPQDEKQIRGSEQFMSLMALVDQAVELEMNDPDFPLVYELLEKYAPRHLNTT